MGNMIIGGFIMVHACNYIGAGLAWFLTCLSGVTGNLLNAAIQPAHHIAVGSSTAVFGLTGAVTAFRAVQDRSSGIRGFVLPLGAGIALLGLTGSAGEHTDIGAHACGFISGVMTGAMAGFMVQLRGFPSRKTDMLLGAAALMIPAIAWFAAYIAQ
jgi:membrane associated rhomboid family serine protease